MAPDNAQGDATGGKFAMQLMQHARAGEIEIRRRREIAYHQADVERTSAPKPLQDDFQNGVSIHVNQGCFWPKGEDPG
jgi:hypothetical protein